MTSTAARGWVRSLIYLGTLVVAAIVVVLVAITITELALRRRRCP